MNLIVELSRFVQFKLSPWSRCVEKIAIIFL